MPTEAIPLGFLLLLLGVIIAAVTAAPGQKPVTTTVHNTTAVVAKESIPVTTDTPMDRLRRFQQSCKGQGKELGKDCLAYNQLVSDMAKHNLGSNDTDLLFSQELSRAVTPQEDLCSNLTELMKHLPSQLMHDALKPFTLSPHCVSWCYQSQGEEEYTVKDSCRVLYVGYRRLVQYMLNPNQAPPPYSAAEQQQPAKSIASNNQQTNLSRDQNKSSNATLNGNGNKEPADKIIPDLSNNPHIDAKSPAPIPDTSKTNEGEEAVVKETKKEKKITLPKAPPQEPDVPPAESADNDVEEVDSQEDNGEPLQVVDDQQNLNEPQGELPETDMDIQNPKNTQENKVQKVETPSQEEMSKTSDILQGSDPFYNQNDSNFFSYFLFAMFSCALLYVAYHNKSKLMALVVEGRRTSSGRGGFSKGRKHTAAYRKLDSNLEEAITSGSASGGHSSSQIIY